MAVLDLYKVIWQNSRHKYPDVNTDFVAVTAGTGAVSVASTLQTKNNDGKTVTVLEMELIRKGIIT